MQNKVKPKLLPRPKASVRSLERSAKLNNLIMRDNFRPIIKATFTGTGLTLIGGTVAVAFNHPFIGTAIVGAGAIGTNTILKKLKSAPFRHTEILAKMVGRPRIARRVASKYKDPEIKEMIIILGNLPFVENRRYFSNSEMEQVRTEVLEVMKTDVKPKKDIIKSFITERAQIIRLMRANRALTTSTYQAILNEYGTSSNSRNLAKYCVELGLAKDASFGLDIKIEGTPTRIIFDKKETHWNVHIISKITTNN